MRLAALWAMTVLGMMAGAALGQQPWDGANPPQNARQNPPQNWSPPAAGQPALDPLIAPQAPTFERRLPGAGPLVAGGSQALGVQQPPPRQPPKEFDLNSYQEAQLNRILQLWEQESAKVKTFSCEFTRLWYDSVFGDATNPDKPRFVDRGEIRYSAPDKGKFVVRGERAEQWVCDGKSLFGFNYEKKQVLEYKLPPQLQGQAIANGPMPFLFGAKAAQLKQRYYLRTSTPNGVQGQIWIEALPRFQRDAANYYRAEIILKTADMQPMAIAVWEPNNKDHKTFVLEKVAINKNDLLRVFGGDEFHAATPYGWKRDVIDTSRGPADASGGAATRGPTGGNLGPR
jgi:TIGR03009 family protein